jgi:hypothetical protein
MSIGLLTLPRTALRGTGFVPDACHVAMLAPSRPERARAVRVLREAVTAGRIDPGAVAEAVANGDSGVAALFQAHATMPPRARLTAHAIDLRAMDAAPDQNVLAGLARLIETLAADGDLMPEALATAPNLSQRELAICLNAAWVRRVTRVTRGLLCVLPPSVEPAATHYVYPAALLHLITPPLIRGAGRDGSESDVDAVIGLSNDAFVLVGTAASTSDETRALRVAWNDVVRALETGTLDPWQVAEETSYLAYMLESLNDLALTCAWDGDEPRVSHEQLAEIAGEMGEDPDDEILQERMRAQLREIRAEGRAPQWTRRSKAFRAWRTEREGTAVGERVEHLLALARWRRRLSLKERLNVSNDEAEGPFAITPVPRAAPFGELLADFIAEEQNQCGSTSLSVGRELGSTLSLGRVLDALIADAAVAGAACALLRND